MKKITLMMLLALGLNTVGHGQANVSLQAPPDDGSSTGLSLANGLPGIVCHRSCYLILPGELTNLVNTNSVITTIGLDLDQGCNVAVTGQYTVYLENTSDVTYNKGTNFATVLTGMSTNYVGNLTFPVNTGTTTVPLPLTANFTYTGGGIYVACEWYAAAPNATLPARTQANSTGLTTPPLTGGGAYASSASLPAPTTLTATTNFRPCFRFTAGNTLTNEVSVTRFDAPGKVSKLFSAGHVTTAQIRNNSNTTLSNISVSLAVAGANTFNDVQTVTSIAAGSFATVSFNPFNPTVNGLNNMTVTVGADQDNGNNDMSWTQSVTCNEFANNPPLAATSFSQQTWGFSTSGIYSYRYKTPSTASLTGVRLAVSTSTSSFVNKQLYGVLMDGSTGAIIATTNTITMQASNSGSFATFDFSPPVVLTGNTDYNIGIAQPTGSVYAFGVVYPTNYTVNTLYTSPLAGGALTNVNRGYMGIEAVLSFSNVAINASASKTVVCKKDGPNTVTLTASGLSTYTWVPSGTGPTLAVTPTVSGTSGAVVYYVSGTDASTGCKSNLASVTISVSACNGLADNDSDGFNINLFPNPAANGKSTISGLVGVNVVSVFNMAGQLISTNTVSEESANIDLSNQAAGNYLIKITDKTSGKTRMVKLVN